MTNLNNHSKENKVALGLVIITIFIYFIVFTLVTVGQHRAMETHTLDLVNMDQAVWNTINGRLLEMSPVPGINTRLARHFEPILLPISLLYLLYNNAETLLILQTAVIALGALPIYWLARNKHENHWIAVIFATLFLLYPSVQAVNTFDFHPVALSITFLLFTIHAIETDRRWQAVFFAILAMGGKEDVPLVIAMLGFFILIFRKDKKLGFIFISIGFAWFIIAFQMIIPHFLPDGFSAYATRYSHWGNTQREMIITLLTHPNDVWAYLTQPLKLAYYRDMLLPFGFTSLLAPQWLLISAPILAINLLSNASGQSIADKNHYVSAIIPAVVVASIYGSHFFVQTLHNHTNIRKGIILTVLGITLTTTSLFQQYYHGLSPLAYTFSWSLPDVHDEIGQSVMAQIPANASVSAQTDLGPQISHREELYLFPRPHDAEYVVLDITSGLFPLRHYEEYVTAVTDTLNSDYGIIDGHDGYLLMQKGGDNQQIPPDFYSFALPDPSYQPQYSIEAEFGSGLHLLGYDFKQHHNTVIQIISYWQIDEPIDDISQINLHIRNGNGNNLFTRTARTTHWFPPTEWPVNTPIAVDFGAIGLSGATFDSINLSLDAKTTENDLVLPIQLQSSAMTPPLMQGGTQINLGNYCYEYSILRECHQVRTFIMPSAAQQTNYTFGGKLALTGYTLDNPSIKSGQTLDFTLFWQNLAITENSYAIFAHLTETEPWLIHAQGDQRPWKGEFPTNLWDLNEIVMDEYQIQIPDDIPSGRYLLRIGVYDPQTGARLSVLDNDHIILTEIHVQ